MDPTRTMTAMARQFEALRNAPGLDPWAPEALDQWAASERTSSGARAAVRFLFEIWNGSDHWRVGKFDLRRDLGAMDDAAVEVVRTWLRAPVFL